MRLEYRPLALALIVAASASAALRCPAEDGFSALGGTAELEARIAALEAQVEEQAEHRDRISAMTVSHHSAVEDAGGCNGCQSCGNRVGRDFFNDCCRGEGFYGGGEIMFLKPFADGIGAAVIDAASADQYLPGWRLWGGYQNCDGLGWRVNWWQWDQTSSGISDFIFTDEPSLVQQRLTFQKLDLLATQIVSFRRWDLTFAAGVTYVGSNNNLSITSIIDPTNSYGLRSRFDGWGLTTGLLAIRDLPRVPGLKLASSVQWSGVYGNSLFSELDPGGERLPVDSSMANILELKIGPQYERCVGRGTTLFAGVGFEAQYWAGLGGLSAIEGIGGDIGLVGFTANTGFRR